jgi:hypothetical protein
VLAAFGVGYRKGQERKERKKYNKIKGVKVEGVIGRMAVCSPLIVPLPSMKANPSKKLKKEMTCSPVLKFRNAFAGTSFADLSR